MYRGLWFMCVLISLFLISVYFIYINSTFISYKDYNIVISKKEYNKPEDFENFDNITGTKDGCYIVPNVVHFIRFNQKYLTFIDLICIVAAYKHQKPDIIYIHTNVANFQGKYWQHLIGDDEIKKIIKINYIEMPTEIYGEPLSKRFQVFHGGDIARLKILMEYGGIYLDNDSYIVRNMNDFRRYELSIGWRETGNISNQVIITHKHARFLKLWLETYRNSYKPESWFYNAGIRPTQKILVNKPYLVHREKFLLAPYQIVSKLYLEKWNDWENLYAIHLYINHLYMLKRNLSEIAVYPVVFNESNIKNYPVTIKDMVSKVYPLDK